MDHISKSELYLHVFESTANDRALDNLLEFANDVFNHKRNSIPQADLAVWRRNLTHEDSALIYATTASTQDTLEPMGLLFIRRQDHAELPDLDSLHVWMAAIAPDARGQGLLPKMIEMALAHARKRGAEWLTIGTVPDRFQRMYQILSIPENGWEFVTWRTTAPETGSLRAVLFKRPVLPT